MLVNCSNPAIKPGHQPPAVVGCMPASFSWTSTGSNCRMPRLPRMVRIVRFFLFWLITQAKCFHETALRRPHCSCQCTICVRVCGQMCLCV